MIALALLVVVGFMAVADDPASSPLLSDPARRWSWQSPAGHGNIFKAVPLVAPSPLVWPAGLPDCPPVLGVPCAPISGGLRP